MDIIFTIQVLLPVTPSRLVNVTDVYEKRIALSSGSSCLGLADLDGSVKVLAPLETSVTLLIIISHIKRV